MPPQLLVGCKKRKVQSDLMVWSLCSVSAGKQTLTETCVYYQRQERKARGNCSRDHSGCLCFDIGDRFSRPVFSVDTLVSLEPCETIPFQTGNPILLSSAQQSEQTLKHSVFSLFIHWDLCFEQPFLSITLALEVQGLGPLPLLLLSPPILLPFHIVVVHSLRYRLA